MAAVVSDTPDASKVESEQIKQFKDFLISYNKLSELCFTDCVHDFTVRQVQDKEDRCAMNCMEKYLKMNQRITQRFQEFQMQANEAAMAAAQKAGALA
ncbi:mitochondrial import inner membrane translocase subunit Tim9-like [Tachypleus tridentatus]|uniref:mitochondrial import inner membrane translocase subunit Tim9-like n=1 Tax=Tachypleus tridentatus TaxID=6853 RepID=UPI003FD5EBEF